MWGIVGDDANAYMVGAPLAGALAHEVGENYANFFYPCSGYTPWL